MAVDETLHPTSEHHAGDPPKSKVTPADTDAQRSEKTIPQEVDLATIVQLSGAVIDREYIKDSFRAIPPEILKLRNISNNLDVIVTFYGIGGVSFDPQSVSLRRQAEASVKVEFNPVTINDLSEGVNVIQCAIDLDSNTTLMLPADSAPSQELPPHPAPVEASPQTSPVAHPLTPPLPPAVTTPDVNFPAINNNHKVISFRVNERADRYVVDFKEYEQVSYTLRTVRKFDDGREELISDQELKGERRVISDNTPPIASPIREWVDGVNGGLHTQDPIPTGWVQDPFGGAWYPSDSDFVKSGFGRGITTIATQDTTNSITTTHNVFRDGGFVINE